ncbi:MAG: hypothetical protein AB1446_11145 [Bacillota bacterium]
MSMRCPGQDRRFWMPADIFEHPCPHCGNTLEFWKDDISVCCPRCGSRVFNPRFDPGCAAWCAYAQQCLGEIARGMPPRRERDQLDSPPAGEKGAGK